MGSGVDPSCVVESAAGNEDEGLVTLLDTDLFTSFLVSSAADVSSFLSDDGLVSLSTGALSTSLVGFLLSVFSSSLLSLLPPSDDTDDSTFS